MAQETEQETSAPYRKEWMSNDQWECYQMLRDLYCGWHHIHGRLHEWGDGIKLNTRHGNFSTYDFSDLTTAVIMAHDRMIRFEICPSGPGMLGLVLRKRHTRLGTHMWERHPTIETSISTFRRSYPQENAK